MKHKLKVIMGMFILISIVASLMPATVAYFISTPWQKISTNTPPNSISIINANANNELISIFIKTNSGQVYQLNDNLYSSSVSTEAWSNVLFDESLITQTTNKPLVATILDPPPANVIADFYIKSPLLIGLSSPVDVYYVLLEDGSLWRWMSPFDSLTLQEAYIGGCLFGGVMFIVLLMLLLALTSSKYKL